MRERLLLLLLLLVLVLVLFIIIQYALLSALLLTVH